MNFNDILKKSFLEQFNTNDLTFESITISLLITALIGVYIFFVYKNICSKSFYSKSFAISLVAISIIIAAIILTIKSNLIISLGMVGALSIVRFRTPVKEPIDLVFLFWSIAIGIICGANLYSIAIISSLLITIIITTLNLFSNLTNEAILLINLKELDDEDNIAQILKENTKSFKILSRNKTNENIEIITKIKTNNENKLIQELSKNKNVLSINLLNQDN